MSNVYAPFLKLINLLLVKLEPIRKCLILKPSGTNRAHLTLLAPLISILLFLGVITASFGYLAREERQREQEGLKYSAEITQQQIRLRLLEHEEKLTRLAVQFVKKAFDPLTFQNEALDLLLLNSEISRISWYSINGIQMGSVNHQESQFHTYKTKKELAKTQDSPEPGMTDLILQLNQNQSTIYASSKDSPLKFVGISALNSQGKLIGVIKTEYELSNLVQNVIPQNIIKQHSFTIINSKDKPLWSTSLPQIKDASQKLGPAYEIDLTAPLSLSLKLRIQGWRTSSALVGNTLFWMVLALSALTVWMLRRSWLHVRRLQEIQDSLIAESNFRRAMENSILTGMRAMDMQGCISYVNRAFCEMTGYSENELIGCTPPYPHWVPERLDETMRFFQQEIEGKTPPGGIEVSVKRKDGEIFDARMYVSPLIDAKGKQTGWMTSMTNITESKRIRDQLTASHERFTTVLEGLDAAVSVACVQTQELLFSNRSYKIWFGTQAHGHVLMGEGFDATQFTSDISIEPTTPFAKINRPISPSQTVQHHEIHIPSLQKWLDVRSRLIQWTDGRVAQMLIATDITARHRAEEQAQHQAEKAQVTSRLITMGEMASSVAHELNQPLTAISNYCNGIISRVESESMSQSELISALEKTSRQAQRAGQVIHRIRAFVKRSEPKKQPSEIASIVEDAIELANISLKRRKVQLHTYLAQRIPTVWCDPILIEQVLLNLLKNAAEAIDDAQMPASRRSIELRVAPHLSQEDGHVIEFSVSDSGPGMTEDIPDRIYEAFFSTKAEGMGIGLSLCRSIIESHHGRMRATNLYNGNQIVGCRFAFTLPVSSSDESQNQSASQLSPIHS